MENQNDKPIEFNELVSYMEKTFEIEPLDREIEPNNENLTRLILEYKLVEAVKMIEHNKNLKFIMHLDDNWGHLYEWHSCCGTTFMLICEHMCSESRDDYKNIIKILQFLIPENMIVHDYCGELTHNYVNYCMQSISRGNIHTARAIYIMFMTDVDNIKFLHDCYKYFGFNGLKNAYDIIIQSQNIIQSKRQNIPNINIFEFFEEHVDMYESYDFIKWDYSICPESYTKYKISRVLKIVESNGVAGLSIIKKFFESIDKE